MARTQRIQHLRSNTGSAIPAAGTLHPAEIAINYADKKWFYGDVNGDPLTPPFIATNQNSTVEPNVTVTWTSDHINPSYAAFDTVIPYAYGIDFAATIISWHTLGGWGLEDLDGAPSGSIIAGRGRPLGIYSACQFDKTASTTAIVELGAGHGLVAGSKIGISQSSNAGELPIYAVYEILASPAPSATTVAINTGVSGTVVAGTCNVVTNETWLQFSTSGCQLTLDYNGAKITSNLQILAINSIFDESGNNRLTAPHLPCTAVNGNTNIQSALNDHESRIDSVERVPIRTITTTAQTAAYSDSLILMNPPAAAITLNLPVITAGDIGKVLNIKNISTFTIVIDANASDVIDGLTTQSLTTQYESLTLVAAAVGIWYII